MQTEVFTKLMNLTRSIGGDVVFIPVQSMERVIYIAGMKRKGSAA